MKKLVLEFPQKTETFFSLLTLSGLHAWEGGPCRTNKFELTHGKKTRGTPFTRMWTSQRPDCNSGCEVVIPHVMRSSPLYSSSGPGTGLGPMISPRLGAINIAP